jgi:plastocyanin
LSYYLYTGWNQITKNNKPLSKNHTIIFNKNGFEPAEIFINHGDIVTFKNNSQNPFWPASDTHPEHTIYSEFDPKKPITSGESWVFRFTKSGVWNFHDHLSPLFRGRIEVRGDSNLAGVVASNSSWENMIKSSIVEGGIIGAFNMYAKLYESEPVFAENCHGYTHIIGQGAYEMYKNNIDLDVDDKVSYCSYGFFHGFIEAMFHDEGSLDKAREFCDYIDNKLRGQTSAIGACLHGIGHGVTDGSDPRAYGNVKALIEPGKKLCEKVGINEYEKQICATGVFNSLEGLYLDPKYKITVDKKDPFWICREQETDYFKKACFDDFKDIIMVIANNDFREAAKFVEGIKEDHFAQGAIDNLATYNAYIILRKPDFNYAIDICHSLQPRLHVDCISGLGAGFMTAGDPGKEYVKAIELCKSPRITKEEREGCFRRILHASQVQYSPEKHKEVCFLVDAVDLKGVGECIK